jgi:hypothetical protein
MVAANRVFLQMTDHDETTRALPRPGEGSPRRIMALIAFQAFCSAYFVVDVFEDFRGGGIEWWHVLPELAATAGLFVGIVFEVKVLRQLLRRQAIMEKSLAVAAGDGVPWKTTLMVGGTLNQTFPKAQAAAMSASPMPWPKVPCW